MLLGASQSLSPVVTFMTLQFTLIARDCFDALQNWSNEHAYVKVILAGRSSGEITDEEAAQKVLVEYFGYPLLEDPRAVMLDALRIRFAVEFNGQSNYVQRPQRTMCSV